MGCGCAVKACWSAKHPRRVADIWCECAVQRKPRRSAPKLCGRGTGRRWFTLPDARRSASMLSAAKACGSGSWSAERSESTEADTRHGDRSVSGRWVQGFGAKCACLVASAPELSGKWMAVGGALTLAGRSAAATAVLRGDRRGMPRGQCQVRRIYAVRPPTAQGGALLSTPSACAVGFGDET